MPRTRQRPRHSAAHRPRSEKSTNGSSTRPAVRARAVTAATGDQPASSSGLTKAPEVPNEMHETSAAIRPADRDDVFMLTPRADMSWAKLAYGPDARRALVRSQLAFCP